jgi:hypothetical protein
VHFLQEKNLSTLPPDGVQQPNLHGTEPLHGRRVLSGLRVGHRHAGRHLEFLIAGGNIKQAGRLRTLFYVLQFAASTFFTLPPDGKGDLLIEPNAADLALRVGARVLDGAAAVDAIGTDFAAGAALVVG